MTNEFLCHVVRNGLYLLKQIISQLHMVSEIISVYKSTHTERNIQMTVLFNNFGNSDMEFPVSLVIHRYLQLSQLLTRRTVTERFGKCAVWLRRFRKIPRLNPPDMIIFITYRR